jgi:Family of unknown function (DUF6174)
MRVGLQVMIAFALLTHAGSSRAQSAALETARATWQRADFSAYEYGYHKYCECHGDAPPETIVTVHDGAVTAVRHRPQNSSVEVPAPRNIDAYWTVDGLFALLDAALTRGAEVRAAYDAALGYPTEIYIDYDRNLIGDELDLRLTRVAALER